MLDAKVESILKEIEDLDLMSRLKVIASVIIPSIQTAVQNKEENVEDIIDVFVYKIYERLYTPEVIAYHLGVIGQILLDTDPKLEQKLKSIVLEQNKPSYVA